MWSGFPWKIWFVWTIFLIFDCFHGIISIIFMILYTIFKLSTMFLAISGIHYFGWYVIPCICWLSCYFFLWWYLYTYPEIEHILNRLQIWLTNINIHYAIILNEISILGESLNPLSDSKIINPHTHNIPYQPKYL